MILDLCVCDLFTCQTSCFTQGQSLFFSAVSVFQCTWEMFLFLTRSCPFSTFSMAWYRSYIVFSAYNGFVTHEKTCSKSCAHVWVQACVVATMWVPAQTSKKGCSYLHLQLHNREHLRSVWARARSLTLYEPLWVAVRFCSCECVLVHTVSVRMFVCVCV